MKGGGGVGEVISWKPLPSARIEAPRAPVSCEPSSLSLWRFLRERRLVAEMDAPEDEPGADSLCAEGLASPSESLQFHPSPLFSTLVASACFRLDAALRLFRTDALACLRGALQQSQLLPGDAQQASSALHDFPGVLKTMLNLTDIFMGSLKQRADRVALPGQTTWQRAPLFPVYLQLKTLSRGAVSEQVAKRLRLERSGFGLVVLPQLRQAGFLCGRSLFLVAFGGEDFGRSFPSGGSAGANPSSRVQLDFDAPVVSAFCGVCPDTVPEAAGSQLLFVLTTEALKAFLLLPLGGTACSSDLLDSQGEGFPGDGCIRGDALVVRLPKASGSGGSCSAFSTIQILPLEDLTTPLPPQVRRVLECGIQTEERSALSWSWPRARRVEQAFAQVEIGDSSRPGTSASGVCRRWVACLGGELLQLELLQGASRFQRLSPQGLLSSCGCGTCDGAAVEEAGGRWRRVVSLEKELLVAQDAKGNLHLLRASAAPRRGFFSSLTESVASKCGLLFPRALSPRLLARRLQSLLCRKALSVSVAGFPC